MSKNIEMLSIVANGLGEIKDEVVFVGGSVAELYADDSASSEKNERQKKYLVNRYIITNFAHYHLIM